MVAPAGARAWRFFGLALIFVAVLLALFGLDGSGGREVTEGAVLYSKHDRDVATTVHDLKRLGLYTTDDQLRFRAHLQRRQAVIVVTRTALRDLCVTRAADRCGEEAAQGIPEIASAYVDGALIVGLNLSLADLEAAIFGAPPRPEAQQDTDEPLLSMLYEESLAGGCGGHGSFSDRLSNWEAGFIMHRAHEVALFASGCD